MPSPRPIKKTTIQIGDIEWTLRLWKDETYDTVHGDDSEAITDIDKKTIDFRKSTFEDETEAKVTIAHETFHAAWPALHLESTTSLGLEDIEEIMASYIGANYVKIFERTNAIYAALTKKKDRI